MKVELIQQLADNFEGHVQHLLAYSEWRNFMAVIHKAKVACEVSEQLVADYFVEVNRMVQLGSGSQREVGDIAWH